MARETWKGSRIKAFGFGDGGLSDRRSVDGGKPCSPLGVDNVDGLPDEPPP